MKQQPATHKDEANGGGGEEPPRLKPEGLIEDGRAGGGDGGQKCLARLKEDAPVAGDDRQAVGPERGDRAEREDAHRLKPRVRWTELRAQPQLCGDVRGRARIGGGAGKQNVSFHYAIEATQCLLEA